MSSQLEIKKALQREFLICAKNPTYFINKYVWIQHPQKTRSLFNTYDFQDKVLKLWEKYDYTIILKSRQIGITTLAAGYALWLTSFHEDKNVLCIATNQDKARNILKKVQFAYENLPNWLKVKIVEDNKLSLRLGNGSQVKATSAASDAGRSESVSLLIVDEAAFIEGVEKIWASSQQTLSTGGKAIVLSTPNGVGNWFHKMWVKAENKESKFVPIRLPWYVHPERDENWRKEQDEVLLDKNYAAQECDCSFNSSGNSVFYSDWVEYINENTIKEPLEKRGIEQNLWVWEPVDYSEEYMVMADVSRGDGTDYSVAHVINIKTNTQVAEFKGLITPKEFGYFLISLATEYNNALLVIKNTGIAWSTIETIIDRGYLNLYYSPKSDQYTAEDYLKHHENKNSVPGFTMSLRTRPLVINKFREFVGEKSTTIRSSRLLNEMKVFIWKNGRPEAQYGYNDDLVLAYSMGMYLRDTSLRFQQQNLDVIRATLSNFKKTQTSTPKGIYTGTGFNQDPFKIKNPYGRDEDISWLL